MKRLEVQQAAEDYAFRGIGVDNLGREYREYDTQKLEGFIAGVEWYHKRIFKKINDELEQNIKQSAKMNKI